MVYDIRKDAVQEDVESFHLTDLSLWGSGGNPARNLRALVLFITKTDKNGARTLQTVTPDTSNPLTVSAWDVSIAPAEDESDTSKDGLYEKILFVIELYDAGTTYVTDDVIYYSSNGKFYKAVQGSTGQLPTNTTYFIEVAAADLYEDEIENDCDTMEVDTSYDLITGNIEEDIVEARQAESNVFLNGKYNLETTKGDYLDSLLNSAEAAMTNNRPYEAEEIIRGMENYLLTY